MQIVTKAQLLIRMLSTLGVLGCVSYVFHRACTKTAIITVKLGDRQLKLRRATSDFTVFHQIHFWRELDFPIPQSPKTIIDCGAYTGISTLFFAKKYPNAQILAVEPSTENYQLLVQNVEGIPNVKLMNAAVGASDTSVEILNSNVEHHSFQFVESENGPGTVPCLQIKSLIEQSGFGNVDLMKMDIEGAEKEVFDANHREWVVRIRRFAIEVHEHLNEGTFESIDTALMDFKKSSCGEYTIYTRS